MSTSTFRALLVLSLVPVLIVLSIVLFQGSAPPIQHQGQTQEALNWAAGRDSLGQLIAWAGSHRAGTSNAVDSLGSSGRDSITAFGRHHGWTVTVPSGDSVVVYNYFPDGEVDSAKVYAGEERAETWAGDSLKWTGPEGQRVNVDVYRKELPL